VSVLPDCRWSVIYLVDFLEYFRIQFPGIAPTNRSDWEELHNEDRRGRRIRTSKSLQICSSFSGLCFTLHSDLTMHSLMQPAIAATCCSNRLHDVFNLTSIWCAAVVVTTKRLRDRTDLLITIISIFIYLFIIIIIIIIIIILGQLRRKRFRLLDKYYRRVVCPSVCL